MIRWSVSELNSTDTIDFAIMVLEERRTRTKNPNSPLNQKITQTQDELRKIKTKYKGELHCGTLDKIIDG